MKTIVAGTRHFNDIDLMDWVLKGLPWTISTVLCGGAPGADSLGETWAHAYQIPVIRFPAAWKVKGKGAGPLRNEAMLLGAQALVVFWDGHSRGTEHMIQIAQVKAATVKSAGGSFPVNVHIYKQHENGEPSRGNLPALPYHVEYNMLSKARREHLSVARDFDPPF